MALVRLTLAVVEEIIEQRMPVAEMRDLIQPGLSIRGGQGPRPRWYFRYSVGKRRSAMPLCLLEQCPDPKMMRNVVATGRLALRENRDPVRAVRDALDAVLEATSKVPTQNEDDRRLLRSADEEEPDTGSGLSERLKPTFRSEEAFRSGGLGGPSTDEDRLARFRAQLDRSEALRAAKSDRLDE